MLTPCLLCARVPCTKRWECVCVCFNFNMQISMKIISTKCQSRHRQKVHRSNYHEYMYGGGILWMHKLWFWVAKWMCLVNYYYRNCIAQRYIKRRRDIFNLNWRTMNWAAGEKQRHNTVDWDSREHTSLSVIIWFIQTFSRQIYI